MKLWVQSEKCDENNAFYFKVATWVIKEKRAIVFRVSVNHSVWVIILRIP